MKPKRNKKYRPKPVAADPLKQFFGGMSGDHVAHLQTLQARHHSAMAAIVEGYGTREHWDVLVAAINLGNVMCEHGFGHEFQASMAEGCAALSEVGKRATRTGVFSFEANELHAINDALASHNAQLENARAVEINRAFKEVLHRVRIRLSSANVTPEIAREVEEGGCVLL